MYYDQDWKKNEKDEEEEQEEEGEGELSAASLQG